MEIVLFVFICLAFLAIPIMLISSFFGNKMLKFGDYFVKGNQNINEGAAFSPIMYNKSIKELAYNVIDEELKEQNFSSTDSTLAVETKRTIIAVIYAVVLLASSLLFIFRINQVIAVLLFIASTIAFLISFFKVDVHGTIYKDFNARPDEDMEYIIASHIQNKASKIPFTIARVIIIISCLVIPFVMFRTPKLFYEEYEDGYGIRFYAGYTFPEELVIPDTYNGKPIRNIRGNVFKGLKGVKKIVLPKELKSINGHSFENSSDLTEVVLPDELESIGAYAFNGCNLKSVTIPEKITEIDTYVFANNTNLTNVTIKGDISRLGSHAFYNDINLEKIDNLTVKELGAYSFSGSGIKDIKLSDELTSIPAFAFSESKITNIVLPNKVLKISESAFENSTLKSIQLNNGLQEISEAAFRNTQLTSVVIPDTVTHISAHAFRECKNLEYVTLSKGLKEIRTSTFRETGLRSIEISDGVTKIGENAFSNCYDLSSVVVPKTLVSIGEKAFRYDSALKSITIPRGTSIGSKAFDGCPAGTNISYYK